MSESTRVQFPRFQHETNPELPINERKLIQRAQQRPWLLGVEVYQVIHPVTIVGEQRSEDVSGNWWGVYHDATKKMVLGNIFYSPFRKASELYRSLVIHHSSLWDQQAIQQHNIEVVLERLPAYQSQFEEVAALLVPASIQDRHAETPYLQRLVIRDDNGEWQEPVFGQPDDHRDFCLMVMSELAIRELSVSETAKAV